MLLTFIKIVDDVTSLKKTLDSCYDTEEFYITHREEISSLMKQIDDMYQACKGDLQELNKFNILSFDAHSSIHTLKLLNETCDELCEGIM